MYNMKHIGKYNVDYAGLSYYDGGIPYQLVIIEEFDEHNKPTGNKRSLYFRCNRTTTEKYVMPDLNTEKKVDEWMGFKDYTKFQIFNCRMAEEAEGKMEYAAEYLPLDMDGNFDHWDIGTARVATKEEQEHFDPLPEE